MPSRLNRIAGCGIALLLTVGASAARSEDAPKADGAPVAEAAATEPADNATLYCRNIASPAADARYARQVNALAALESELETRIAELEKKRAEIEEWVSRREELMRKADDSVVAIYSQMRPDAAAQQIGIMDPGAAAAILAKVSARTASAILNEMNPATAAHLTNVMAGKTKSAAADPGT